MNDLTLTHSGEFDVDHVEGNTDKGVEFVDAWMRGTYTVIDSGRIILPPANAKALVEMAHEAGLTYEIVGAL
jgi:hypothetical protein